MCSKVGEENPLQKNVMRGKGKGSKPSPVTRTLFRSENRGSIGDRSLTRKREIQFSLRRAQRCGEEQWRVQGRARSGQREGVQRINPLARVWAGVRPSGAGKESARSAKKFGQGQPPAGRLRCRTADWRPGGCPLAKARIQKRVACIWVRRVAASANTRPAPKPRARRAASRVWPLVVTLSTK